MISRISFFKLVREEWKHHLVSILAVVLVFLGEILFFYFDISSTFMWAQYAQREVEHTCRLNLISMIPSMFLAVFLAAEYFSYLHSQRKTDFYLSLPIKRSTQFLMGVCVSLSVFFIPCVIATLVEIGIVAVTGYGSAAVVQNMIWMLIGKVIAFMAVWVMMTLAVVATGHLAVAVLAFLVGCAYIPLFIKELYPTFAALFYDTFQNTRMGEAWNYFSPISLVSGFANAYDYHMGEFFQYLIVTVIFIVVVGGIAWKLYQIRPAEAAKRAMAFEKTNSVIRFLVVVPFALYFGYFLDQMAMVDSKIWLIVGIVVGVILFHGIMESTYAFDPRKMFTKKKQAFAAVCICLLFLGGFYLTKDMYNGYLPASEDLKSVKITLNSTNINLYDQYDRAGVSGEEADRVLELVERVILQNNTKKMEDFPSNISIKYEMVNGKEKGRTYGIDTEDEVNRALLDQIVATEEFKKHFYNIYQISEEAITEISLENTFTSEKLWFSEEEQKEFLDIYRKELSKLTFTEMEEKARWARVCIEDSESGWIDDCYIYENFDETIAFLKKHDIEVKNPMDCCEVLSVELFGVYDEKGDSMYIIQNTEVLDSLKDRFILDDLYHSGYVNSVRNSEYALAEIKTGNRIENKYVFIREPEIKILQENMD